LFFHIYIYIGNFIIPTDELIFFRGYVYHQPEGYARQERLSLTSWAVEGFTGAQRSQRERWGFHAEKQVMWWVYHGNIMGISWEYHGNIVK
jgi:hypothetical protein